MYTGASIAALREAVAEGELRTLGKQNPRAAHRDLDAWLLRRSIDGIIVQQVETLRLLERLRA